MDPMTLALILFGVMYVLLLVFSDWRWIIAPVTAVLFLVLGILPLDKVAGAINWNVLMMLAGTMATVELFIQSNMPARMAEKLLQKVPNVQWAVVALSLFSGIISAFVDNVATVLMVAPVGLAVAKKLKTNPVPVIIAIAVSSNLQGAATLVGDTTSILLAGAVDMSFNDFFWFHGRPGIAWAVEVGALLTVPVLLWLFRREKDKVHEEVTAQVKDYVPTFLMLGTVLLLILASQFENRPELTNGMICCGVALVGIVYELIRQRNGKLVLDVLKAVDYKTLILLAGLFLVIQGITEAGVIAAIAELFVKLGGGSVLDCSKAIAAGAKYDGEPWDLITYKVPTKAALPIVDIMTLAATGSEYDCGGVISRTETNDKVGYMDPHLYPVASFLDPTYTFTVGAKHTAAGVADAINHVCEQYFALPGNDVIDGFCESLIRTLMKWTPVALKKPDDYEARAEIMFACTFGCNGILSLGMGESGWPMHMIEHALSAYYDITHGQGLAIIMPHWMRYVLCEKTLPRFVKFGVNVMGISPELPDMKIAEKAIDGVSQFFGSLGMPMTLREVGIDDSRLQEMAHHVAVNEGLDNPAIFFPLRENDILAILKAAL